MGPNTVQLALLLEQLFTAVFVPYAVGLYNRVISIEVKEERVDRISILAMVKVLTQPWLPPEKPLEIISSSDFNLYLFSFSSFVNYFTLIAQHVTRGLPLA